MRHVDITAHDTRPLIAAYRTCRLARELARAAEIYERMLADPWRDRPKRALARLFADA